MDRVNVKFELHSSPEDKPHCGATEMSPAVPALPGSNFTTIISLTNGERSDFAKTG